MSAVIYQLRDYRRKEEKLEKLASEIMSQIDTAPSEMIPYHGAGIDGMVYESSLGYVAPEKDPA